MLEHLVNNKVGQLVMSAEGVTELSVIVIDILYLFSIFDNENE